MSEQRHNFEVKLEKLLASGELTLPDGSLGNISIAHDDACGYLKGKRCDCDPKFEIRSHTGPGKLERATKDAVEFRKRTDRTDWKDGDA